VNQHDRRPGVTDVDCHAVRDVDETVLELVEYREGSSKRHRPIQPHNADVTVGRGAVARRSQIDTDHRRPVARPPVGTNDG
jgi:hypothetical protein